MKTYLVGGAVRDEIMGRKSKDLDYSVVVDESDIPDPNLSVNSFDPFEFMATQFETQNYKIFVRTPEHFTIRAQTPDRKETADFVLAREEGPYTDGRRPDWVRAGTLEMDLARRDFCFNAIAKDAEGNFIDPHGGRQDIKDCVIRAVGNAHDRLTEDALRAVRALRFAVTLGFRIDKELEYAMRSESVCVAVRDNISDERIAAEVSKMMRYDTVKSMILMVHQFPALTGAMFAGSVSLDSTMKTKGRGK